MNVRFSATSLVRPFKLPYMVLLGVMLSGCLPNSCNRTESRDLFPADSLSREYAETIPVDTLSIVDWIETGDSLQLEYPRTLEYAENGDLWVSDTERHQLTRISESGDVVEIVSTESYQFPYLSGFRGDSVIVFSAGTSEVVTVFDGAAVARMPVPDDGPSRGVFRYAAANRDHLYLKVIADEYDGYIVELTEDGQELARWTLDGPFWQYAGLLRLWEGSLISLSGYRPLIHTLDEEPAVSSVTLHGFDSPMLARSRQFVLGDQAQPPLLSASAAAAGEFLFLLNMRPGWLLVDVYDRSGVLQYILTQPSPEFNQNYYPSDISVKEVELKDESDGRAFEIAVAVIEPEPRIERYLAVLR